MEKNGSTVDTNRLRTEEAGEEQDEGDEEDEEDEGFNATLVRTA